MGVNGFGASMQDGGDFLGAESFGDEAHDFKFAGGERRDGCPGGSALGPEVSIHEFEAFEDFWRISELAGGDLSNGFDNVIEGICLREVTPRSGLDRGVDVSVPGVGGKHDDAHFGVHPSKVGDHREGVGTRHVHIHEDNLGCMFFTEGDDVVRGFTLCEDVEIVFEFQACPHPFSRDFVIINYHYADHSMRTHELEHLSCKDWRPSLRSPIGRD